MKSPYTSTLQGKLQVGLWAQLETVLGGCASGVVIRQLLCAHHLGLEKREYPLLWPSHWGHYWNPPVSKGWAFSWQQNLELHLTYPSVVAICLFCLLSVSLPIQLATLPKGLRYGTWEGKGTNGLCFKGEKGMAGPNSSAVVFPHETALALCRRGSH